MTLPPLFAHRLQCLGLGLALLLTSTLASAQWGYRQSQDSRIRAERASNDAFYGNWKREIDDSFAKRQAQRDALFASVASGQAPSPGGITAEFTIIRKAPDTKPRDPVAVIKDNAKRGDPAYMGTLGSLYAEGKGVPKDLAEAERWLKKAEAGKFAPAVTWLHALYAGTFGGETKLEPMLEYAAKSADLGLKGYAWEAFAGLWRRSGYQASEPERQRMKRYIARARSEGNADDRWVWREVVADVLDTPAEYEQLLSALRPAAEASDAAAMSLLAQAYRRGDYGLPSNASDAARWYAAAAAKGDAVAAFEYGARLYTGEFFAKDTVLAAKLLRQAADSAELAPRSRREASLRLAFCFRDGACGETRNLARFYAALDVPLQMGSRVARFERGLLLGRGTGVARDDAAAYRLFKEAADTGMVGALYQQALFLYRGRGIAADTETAIAMFWKAAEAGSINAADALTAIFEDEAPPKAQLQRATALLKTNQARSAADQAKLDADL
ncbi:tetratricopeptide repeat protein [Roseateles paludis]|uniref:Sel1 repeat family protein n=1 Tax=Roseateles paludis TaxID=3145238 RepID=A0ABV0G0I9_9BURK